MNREQACNYLRSSGFSEEQIRTIEGAFTCDKCVYSTSEGCQYDDIMETIPPFEDCIRRDELLKAIDTWDKFGCDANTRLVPYQDHYIPYIHYDDVVKCIKGMPSVNPQKPKSECEHDHEILNAYSDGASAVLESLIEQYEHYLELLDADMKDGSATIVTKTKYAVYTEVVEQLKEVSESEGEE